MDNRDFRERLRKHSVEPSISAWEQMESMLNAMPIEENKDKKRPFFWLFLFGSLIVGLLLVSHFMFRSSEMTSNQSLGHNTPAETTTNNTTQHSLTVNENKSNENTVSVSSIASEDNKNDIAKLFNNQKNTKEVLQKEDSKNAPIPLDNNSTKKQTLLSQSENGINAIVENVITANNMNESISNESKTIDQNILVPSTTKEVVGTPINTIQNSSSSSHSKGIDTIIQDAVTRSVNTKLKEEVAEINTGTKNSKKRVNEPIDLEEREHILVSNISYLSNQLPIEGKSTDIHPTEVKVYRPSQFFWFLEGGYASFNNNPGLTFAGGVVYDVDRILDFEVHSRYSYGKGATSPSTELRTNECQFDFSGIIHLNLVKKPQYNLSFDLGAGYTFYSGERVILSTPPTVDIRSSRGRNLQLGFSYNYTIDSDRKIGLRIGAISYDDAVIYSSLKYIQRF